VDGGDLPLERALTRPESVAAHLDVGQIAGDEEADRAQGIGPPDETVVRSGVEPALERAKGREVEEHGSDELDAAAPPVDAARLPGEKGKLRVPESRAGVGVDRLQPLEERGRGEEDRADKEDQPVGARADELLEAGKRADEEARRPDREQD